MNIFYYLDVRSNVCPVKEYLKKFRGKTKLLLDLDGKIRSIANKGSISLPIAKPLQNYSIFEIMKPFRDLEIRLLCVFVNGSLVLLHAFDKPKHYENTKKINKYIEKNYKIGQNYYNFLKDEKEDGRNKEEYR